jgi:hypothetical protein
MSGGYFNYDQYKLGQIADDIQQLVHKNKEDNNFDDEVIDSFKVAVDVLRVAQVLVHRIDYLVSNDDGVDRFKSRLQEEIKEVGFRFISDFEF